MTPSKLVAALSRGNYSFSRRRLLQQAGLWSVLWPLLRFERAKAQADLAPRRVLIFFSPNGPIMERGPASGSETKFTLGEFWKPLERHQADGLFFTGMHQAGVPFGEHNEYGHQSAGTGALTARTTEGTNHATGPSLDQFIGQELQRAGIVTPQRSLLWGLHGLTGHWGPWYEAAGKAVNPVANPYSALAGLLPNIAPSNGPRVDPALLRRSAALEAALADCPELRGSLGREGKELLDYHCGNLASLQTSVTEAIARPRAPTCERPSSGPDTILPEDAPFHHAENVDETMRAFRKLIPLALACDVTRVIGFSFGDTAARFGIPSSYGVPSSAQVDSGDSGPQHHAWTHVYEETADKHQALRAFTNWYSEQVALVIDELKATPDVGGGTLFDSTVILWTSELGHHPGNPLEPHPNNHVPVLLFGKGQGTISTGRLYDGAGEEDSALTLHQLFVSLARYVGLPNVDSFGNAGTGPLDWLDG